MNNTQFNKPYAKTTLRPAIKTTTFVKPTLPKANAAVSQSSAVLSSAVSQSAAVPSARKMSPELFKIIEKRNQDILKYILEMKYMTPGQVRKRFFGFAKEKQEAYTTAAIEKLSELKYISQNKQGLLLATLETEKYLATVAEGKTLAKPVLRPWDPEVNHDLMLVGIRMRFEELNFISRWYSENMMKASASMTAIFKDLPDAMVTKKDGRSYFLELEISRKANQRYADRLLEYQKVLSEKMIIDEKIDGVMFLCRDIAVADIIKKIAKDLDIKVSIKMVSDYFQDHTNETHS